MENIEMGISLEISASLLTKGLPGGGVEDGFPRWHHFD